VQNSNDPRKPNNPVGMCLGCGHRLTLCGRPFTAEIECPKCFYINSYRDSQQPVAGRVRSDMEFIAPRR
jgi:hypothetical protein